MQKEKQKAYQIREGLVLETVCGQHLLIATLKAREVCPYVTQLNEASFLIWEMMFQEKDEMEMVDTVCKQYGISEDEAREAINKYMDESRAGHYII